MFGKFLASYRLSDSPSATSRPTDPSADDVQGFADFMSRFAGATFEEGLYRVHTTASTAKANEIVREAFPAFSERIICFGFDWLGGEFSLDSARRERGEPLVLMFEPGTGEALEVDATFERFHEVELVEFSDAAVARGFFNEWAAKNAESLPLAFHDCVGYRVPPLPWRRRRGGESGGDRSGCVLDALRPAKQRNTSSSRRGAGE